MTPNNSNRKLLPETRTVRALMDDGFVADNAVIKRGHFSSDFLGFADVVAFRPGKLLLVQATTSAHVSERVKKVVAHPNTLAALEGGAEVEVWGWYRDRDEPRVVVIERGVTKGTVVARMPLDA